MKGTYLIIILFIVLLSSICSGAEIREIYSDVNTDRYLVTTLPNCFGNVLIKARGTEGVGNISFINFELNDKGLYEASCDKLDNKQIVLQVVNKDTNEYDIVVEYYLDDDFSLNSIRTLNFNNVAINPQEIKTIPSEFIVNWVQTIVFILVCIFILILIGFGIYKIVKYESKEEREERLFLEGKDRVAGEEKKKQSIDEEFDAVIKDIEDDEYGD